MQENEYPAHPLRVARVEKGLTQDELAQEIGLGVSTIRRAEQWFPLNLKTQRILSIYFKKTPKELGLQGRGWTQADGKALTSQPAAANPAQRLPVVVDAPAPLPRKVAPSPHYTPSKAIDALAAQPNVVTHEHAGAWLALGTSHLAQLFDEGWSLENILNSLRVVMQGAQGMSAITRRQLLQLSGAAMVSGIALPTGEHVSEEERIEVTRTLGESIASSFKLFHRTSNAQILATGQAQLALLKQAQFILCPITRAMLFAPVYNLIGLALHFQERYQEALHFHIIAHTTAREAGDIWMMIQSLICQTHEYQALNKFTETEQVIEAALRLLKDQTDEIFIRAKAHLLGCWTDSAMTARAFSTAHEKLAATKVLLDQISPNEEFDHASWLQLAGKLSLMMDDCPKAIHYCNQALQMLPQDAIVRQVITLIPLIIAYARQREMDTSLHVAEKTVPMLVTVNAPMTNKQFREYMQEDLLRAYPNEQRVCNFVADMQNQFTWLKTDLARNLFNQ